MDPRTKVMLFAAILTPFVTVGVMYWQIRNQRQLALFQKGIADSPVPPEGAIGRSLREYWFSAVCFAIAILGVWTLWSAAQSQALTPTGAARMVAGGMAIVFGLTIALLERITRAQSRMLDLVGRIVEALGKGTVQTEKVLSLVSGLTGRKEPTVRS